MNDQAEREPLYQQADQILHDDVAWLWIAHTGVPLGFRSCIDGYHANPMVGVLPHRRQQLRLILY